MPKRSRSIVCDCAADPEGLRAPTLCYAMEDGAAAATGVDSFGTAVTWWIEAIETGGSFIDPDDGVWTWDSLPTDREDTGLV